MREFRVLAGRLKDLAKTVDSSIEPEKKSFLSYNDQKQGYRRRQLETTIGLLKQKKGQLSEIRSLGNNGKRVDAINTLVDVLQVGPQLLAQAEELDCLVRGLEINEVSVPPLPSDIRDEVTMDIKELHKCFSSGCYRSVVVLCGRIIEVALHRKYFEVTGQDILEKNPGIGLGKLIAKLSEKNVAFDPGLTQQIHLINQVRVFSVHKKQEPFYPTESQSRAIMLFTLDVLEKMYRSHGQR
ncbi:MAG: hypothetical protein ACQESG_03280 [Nanobdellota archaeon]